MRINKLLAWVSITLLLQACVAVNPQPSKNEKASKVNVELGIGYMQQKNNELANEKLLKALRQNPKNVKAHYIYAILQDRLLQNEVAEYHYKTAVKLGPKNSEALNNYGAFLCRNERALESEEFFLRALKNPLYRTPEFAYTNAAICMLKVNQIKVAKEYLTKALAAKSNFGAALLPMGELLFDEGDHANAKPYLDRFHLVSRASAKSLWLAIRNEIELGGAGSGTVEQLGDQLQQEFADSEEFRAWQQIK